MACTDEQLAERRNRMLEDGEHAPFQWQGVFPVYPPLFLDVQKTLVGDQIILPASLLDEFS